MLKSNPQSTRRPALALRRRASLAVALAVCAAGASSGTASASYGPDASCATNTVRSSFGLATYWTAENVGLVGWRVEPSFTARDRCDHGALQGSVRIYDANIRAKGGSYRAYVSYKRSGSNTWTRSLVSMRYWFRASGYDNYGIFTDNNIGMTRTGRITAAKVSIYLIFNGVPGASRSVRCDMVARTCGDYFGL